MIKSIRIDGIQSYLNGYDRRVKAFCNASLFDADLLQQLAGLRGLVNDTDQTLEAEAAPKLEIAQLTSSFVPYVDVAGGGCAGPFIDFAISLLNRGGDYPRRVDLEKRSEMLGQNAATSPYFTVIMELDFGNGLRGFQNIAVKAEDLPEKVFRAGATLSLPLRMAVNDNQKEAQIAARIDSGRPLVAVGEAFSSDIFNIKIDIPIWDLYIVSIATVSGIDEKLGGIYAASHANVINRSPTPTPGPVEGTFIYRRTLDGPSIASIQGRSTWPIPQSNFIEGEKPVPAKVDGVFFIQAQLILLCPDGSYGKLADGNVDDNARVLEEKL